jgi:hypothetical protein
VVRRAGLLALACVLVAAAGGCGGGGGAESDADRAKSGGGGTVDDATGFAFALALQTLPSQDRRAFAVAHDQRQGVDDGLMGGVVGSELQHAE